MPEVYTRVQAWLMACCWSLSKRRESDSLYLRIAGSARSVHQSAGLVEGLLLEPLPGGGSLTHYTLGLPVVPEVYTRVQAWLTACC